MRAMITALALVGCHKAEDRAVPPPPPKPAAPVPVAPIAGVTPVEADYTIKDFAFADGSKLPLRMHYLTFGTLKRDAAGHATNAVIVMHGTTGSGRQFTRKQFADELFGPGQPLDLTKYYVILPDDIGHGASSKPSDGLHAKFPKYGYHDMVAAEHALVTDGLGVDHLRLVMGTSMGCMHAWMWAEQWPDAMDAVMPLACLPVQIAGRNRMWRQMIAEAIRNDPAWHGGDYTTPPHESLRTASSLLAIAGTAPLADQKRMPTRDAADKETLEVIKRLANDDANDVLYAVEASRDYDPSAQLEAITAPVTFVNSGDDFINPPELGIAEREIKRVKRGKFILIPASESTHGHGTHTWAVFWKSYLEELLAASAH